MEASGSPRRFLGSLTRCDHFVSAHGKIGMCVQHHRPLVTAPDCPHSISCSLAHSLARPPFVCRRIKSLARAVQHHPPTGRCTDCPHSITCSLARTPCVGTWMIGMLVQSTIGTQTHSRTRTLSSLAHEQAPQHRGSRSTHSSSKQIWLWASQCQPPRQSSRGRRSCRRCKRGSDCARCSAHRVGASD